MTFAQFACGLSGTPATCTPAAHDIASMMSESKPPHLPSARAGRIRVFQVMPVMPTALFESAPMIPVVRVPCHELLETPQPVNGLLVALFSAAVIQSPA